MIRLENEALIVDIAELGAEVRNVLHKDTQLSYMWSGDAAYWGRVSPVLFPIVGRLKGGQYTAEGKTYELSQHGFLRDAVFQVSDAQATAVTFAKESNGEYRDVYPYEFRVEIRYRLEADQLHVDWKVNSLEEEDTMYFSIGAHPAFRVPLQSGEHAADYKLHLKPVQDKQITTYELVDGLIQEKEQPAVLPAVPIQAALFENDALVYGHIEEVRLQSSAGNGVAVSLSGFPYVGIWSKYDAVSGTMAPFVCIEPWFGIADTTDSKGVLSQKAGIQKLAPDAEFNSSYRMTFF
ncbi:aldose 1-epimerase family protein [Terribacillus saccharophilus]|uniref:aldose 1-epimerase family protein n=1 Tax=Terribacillus saccharophilus TaxID=361277 RepID=UPI000BA7DB8A|nr:aldose 1-epimerase family protein [Terribacillus saccharophilus]PAF19073.1 aldose epimerase [Terribacillus saccharophilus]